MNIILEGREKKLKDWLMYYGISQDEYNDVRLTGVSPDDALRILRYKKGYTALGGVVKNLKICFPVRTSSSSMHYETMLINEMDLNKYKEKYPKLEVIGKVKV